MSDRKKIVVISQARMTSSRLPGKVLKEVKGKSLLKYHVDRLESKNWQLVIATTTNETDNPIITWCDENEIACFRGSEHNVLQRFYQAAKFYQADIIIRVTSDCPFIDSNLIHQGIELFEKSEATKTYVSNCFPRTFARGFDFEIFSFTMLEDAYKHATSDFDLEHVTPYLWQNKSGDILQQNIAQPSDNSSLRLCVDMPEDFELIKILIEQYQCDTMDYHSIEMLMQNHPELQKINAHVEQKKR